MKPDWDKLMAEFNDSPTQLVADVDCTAEGKPLCDANGVADGPFEHGFLGGATGAKVEIGAMPRWKSNCWHGEVFEVSKSKVKAVVLTATVNLTSDKIEQSFDQLEKVEATAISSLLGISNRAYVNTLERK